MPRQRFSSLTSTDLSMATVDGEVLEKDGFIQVRRRKNPGYYWGNYLLLPSAPEATELEGWVETARDCFRDDREVKHVLLRWDGAPLGATSRKRARDLGMTSDGGLEMISTSLKSSPSPEIEVRPLDLEVEGPRIIALNIACDGAEEEGATEYCLFKKRLRESWWLWHEAGIASWWGAFIEGELVGQCGMVRCSDGWGRFQSVETHPEFRRRGVCSTLVSTVGNDALGRGGCSAVILGADGEGPALSLYRRLGFEPGEKQHSLLLGGESVSIRSEKPSDRAEVKALVSAAFERSDESDLIEALDGEHGVISLVAQKDGTLLGHLLFSPVTVTDSAGIERREIALGPIAVRPTQQGNGVGTALIEGGLRQCREAGWSLVFVLGDPRFYQRFGWQVAAQHRIGCRWDQSGRNFQVLELEPEALSGCQGEVSYHQAFDEVG